MCVLYLTEEPAHRVADFLHGNVSEETNLSEREKIIPQTQYDTAVLWGFQ